MKSAIALGALALVAGTVAHEHQHEKFHQQRAAAAQDASACSVSLVTVTSYGEWGLVPVSTPSSSSSATPTSTSSSVAPPPPSSTSSSSSAAPPPPAYTASSSSSAPAPPAYTPETTSASAPAYKANVAVDTSSEAAPAPAAASTPAPAPQKAGVAATIAPNGDKWAFCYTPYTASGGCKSADQVNSDIASLKAKGFSTVRTYANDCSGLVNIGTAARNNGMKMLVGINIDASGIGSYSDGQIDALTSWAQWDLVEMVIVGNEAVFNGWTSAGALAGYISSTKGRLASAGYSGPVTTTEPLNIIEQYGSTLCPVVDVIGANIHPFFNSAVSAVLAGPFVASQLSDLAGVCNNAKPAYILETGWPSGGDANGLAIPGPALQITAITQIMAAVGGKAAIFSFINDDWKAPGAFGVEQHWGCADLF